MNIKDLNLSKLQMNPLSPYFMRDMEEKVPGLKRDYAGISRKSVYTFIVLMYDPRSPLMDMKDINWWSKKYEAAEASGFRMVEKDGKSKFDTTYENILLGKNEDFVVSTAAYVAYVHNPIWTEVVYLSEMLLKYTLDSLGGRTGDVAEIKAVSMINTRLDILLNRVFSLNEENDLFKQKLYLRIEEYRLKIKPEDYAERLIAGDKLVEDSPYGDYTPEELTFIGNEIPNE